MYKKMRWEMGFCDFAAARYHVVQGLLPISGGGVAVLIAISSWNTSCETFFCILVHNFNSQ